MKINTLIFSIILFLSTLLTLPAYSAQQWIPFIPGTDSAEPVDISIVSSNVDEIIVNFSFPGMFTDHADGSIYTQISIPDCGYTTTIGKPQLPMLGRFIAIPDGASVSVVISNENPIDLDNYTIYPAQAPLADSDSSNPTEIVADSEIYGINPPNRFFPSSNYSLGRLHIIRGCRVRIFRLFPVQYNPYSRIIRAFSNIRVRFIFRNGGRSFIENRLRNASFDQLFKKLLLNDPTLSLPVPVRSKRTAYDDGNSFLIITHPDFATAAERLKQWKNKKGISTEIWTLNGHESADDITQYIKNKYNNADTPPTYVLLIGDSNKIPVHYKTPHPRDGQLIATDLYYATVDGDDYFPDINIGRLSVETREQAEKRVLDIINYEKNPVADDAFYQKAAICAYFQDYPIDGKADRRFAQTSEDIALFLENSGYGVNRLYTTEANRTPLYWSTVGFNFGGGLAGNPGNEIPEYLQKPQFLWDADRIQISNAINEGRFLVMHRDHGAKDRWGDPAYSITDILNLINGNKLPVVFSINCQTGWFDNGDSFSEAWERNPNGGAIGIIAATRVSYSGHNDRLAWGWMDAIWPEFNQSYQPDETPFDHPMWEMGPVLNYGKYYYAANYGEGIHRKAEFEMFHWFGDPTMQIRTKTPENLNVTHASTIAANASFIEITVDQPDPLTGTLICISQDGIILAKKLSSGQQTEKIVLPGQLMSDKPIDVIVSRHDYTVYESSIAVSASSSLTRGIVEFIDSSGNPVIIYKAGTVNEVKVRVTDSDRNTNPLVREKVTVTLTSDTDNNSIPASFTEPIPNANNKGNAQIADIKLFENTKSEDWYIDKKEDHIFHITGSISGQGIIAKQIAYSVYVFQSSNGEIEFDITGTPHDGDSFTLTTIASKVLGESLELIEIEANSGIFEAVMPLNESSPITNNAALEIETGDWITAYYNDPADEFGHSVRISSKAIYAQGTIIHGVTYYEDTTWTKEKSPYLISDNVIVEFGTTLTIESGVIINFMPEKEIKIIGNLIAKGTETDPIIFTSCASQPDKNDWNGIKFDSKESSGYLNYVVIEYASNSINLIGNCRLNIQNSNIRFNENGIYSHSGTYQYEIIVSNCIIEENRYGINSQSNQNQRSRVLRIFPK